MDRDQPGDAPVIERPRVMDGADDRTDAPPGVVAATEYRPPDGPVAAPGALTLSPCRIEHDGRFGEIFVLFLINLVNNVLTLGTYRFWGKTRIRRYLWTRTSIDGERLEYLGTGLELFLGFVFAILFMAPAIVAINVYGQPSDDGGGGEVVAIVVTVLFYGLLSFLYGVAVYSAHRYKVSRTAWRGIRGGVTGSAWKYGGRAFVYSLLVVATLGFYSPSERVKLWTYMVNTTRFGDRAFHFEGSGRDLLGVFTWCWVLWLPTLTLSMTWYRAAALRYLAANCTYDNLRFGSTVTGRALLKFRLTNLALLLGTLGFAWPQVALRHARFISEHLTIVGVPDPAKLRQTQEARSRFGEGLADFLNVGGF